MFHTHGYNAVSVMDVTAALSIKPPSLCAVFGNKIGLYKRVLDRYVQAETIPFNDILRPDEPVSEYLIDLFEEAARHHAANPHAPGCLILEGTYSNDLQTRKVVRNFYSAAEYKIHDFIAQRHPKKAGSLADYTSIIMLGLSGEARYGHPFERLLANARIASVAARYQLSR